MLIVPLALAALLAIPAALAQDGLFRALQAAGLNTFVRSARQLNQTATGRSLLTLLSGEQNLTLFAPNDISFTGLLSNISHSPQLLADTFAYHIVSSEISPDAGTFSAITIGSTYLNDPHLVALEGGKSQVLAWSKQTRDICNQNTNVIILKTMHYNNILIHILNAVIDVPGYFPAVVAQHNLTALARVLNNLQYTAYPAGRNPTNTSLMDALSVGGWDSISGYTFFAPSNAAFQSAATHLTGPGNITTLMTLMKNHIINGSSIYSPTLFSGSPSYISAVGEPLSLSTNATGTYVTSSAGASSFTARIVQTDLLVNNGVIHVIDAVLANTASDPAAASSAYDSATLPATGSATSVGTHTLMPTARPTSGANSIVGSHHQLPGTWVGTLMAACGLLSIA